MFCNSPVDSETAVKIEHFGMLLCFQICENNCGFNKFAVY